MPRIDLNRARLDFRHQKGNSTAVLIVYLFGMIPLQILSLLLHTGARLHRQIIR